MIEIRPARGDRAPADALLAAMVAEIVTMYGPLEERNAPSATPAELWAPGGTYLVLFEDGEPVAGGGIKSSGPNAGEIKRMYVVPAARGRGHARRLLEALEEAGRDLGLARLRLDTGPQQPRARALYERAGYRAVPDYNGNSAASFWGEKDLWTGRAVAAGSEPARGDLARRGEQIGRLDVGNDRRLGQDDVVG